MKKVKVIKRYNDVVLKKIQEPGTILEVGDKRADHLVREEMAEYVTKTLETRKPPKLSPSQLETLTVIAYYQPATKAYVETIRGVDSAYSVSALLTKKLIRECGRLNVPGRPIVYETTPDFLRVFGLESLAELPEIEKVDLHVDPSQVEPLEQKQEESTQPDASAPVQQEIPL